jgi:hypothetical protein
MTIIQPERQIVETPVGRGWVFKGIHAVAEVDYELQVSRDVSSKGSPGKPVITGRIKRVDEANILWATELHTLHLQDRRKLDFICVNFDPDCNIASDSGFYV